jgi:hypothetical protein
MDLREAALGEEAERDEGSAESPCEIERDVSFLITGTSKLGVGEPLLIRIGIPPTVLRQGEEVGTVSKSDAALIQGCLEIGYRMKGRVSSVDTMDRTGTARVRGAK